jgi:Tfp pilus assembly protein FimT
MFDGWSGGLVGNENPDTIIVVSDTSITATFTQTQFVLTRNVVGSGSIVADPDSATYSFGDTVVVTAVPDPGWMFDGWSGGLVGNENPDTIIVVSDTSITATFTQTQFVVTRNVVGSGSIVADPDSASYVYGDTVVVTAVPDPGWMFDGWSGGLVGNENPDTIIVASDTSITATFTQTQYVLTRNVVGSGSIVADPDSATYSFGDTVVVTAVPDSAWYFVSWSGGLSGTENPDTIIVVSDTSITATFTQDIYQVTVSIAGGGHVVKAPAQAAYALGDTVILTAVADSAYAFDHWSGDLTGSENPDTVVVDSSLSITATFQSGPSAIRPPSALARLTLLPNAPNPFQDGTSIRFGLPEAADVEIEIYDVAGRLVHRKRLPQQAGGWHHFYFEPNDIAGGRMPAGVYFYRVKALGHVQTRKMVIIR